MTSDLKHLGNQKFLALLDEVEDTHVRKAAGYSGVDNPDTWANFREAEGWGLTPLQGCLVRMGDKYRRAQNVRRNPNSDQVGEPLRATLMDLANYALIAVCLLEEEQEVADRKALLDYEDEEYRFSTLRDEALAKVKTPRQAVEEVIEDHPIEELQ